MNDLFLGGQNQGRKVKSIMNDPFWAERIIMNDLFWAEKSKGAQGKSIMNDLFLGGENHHE